MEITPNSTIEEIIDKIPKSMDYFQKKGIKCFACGDIVWDTLKEATDKLNYSKEQLAEVIDELNLL